MSYKFRNSFFGFNKEDVLSYVVNSKDKEKVLNNSLDELKKECNLLKVSNNSLSNELSDVTKKLEATLIELNDFKAREEVLTKLSESIGKLYLVAKSNAESVIKAARENAAISEKLTSSNLEIAQETTTEFEEINKLLTEKTNTYMIEINQLKARLESAKESILINKINIQKSTKDTEDTIFAIDNKVKI